MLVREDLPPDARLRDLGLHRLKDLARAQPLYQVVAQGLPAEFPPLHSLDARAHNLPVQLTTFVGREREIGEVREFLTSARLVTLTGTGGAGKTRLALQVAAEVLSNFADGAWFAELAPLTDPTLIPQAVASILEVREEDRRSLADALDDFLRAKSLLLILDNCEHLAAACADLTAALLRHCPFLRVLATSREPLGIPGELTYPVPPLSLPDVERPPAPEDLMRFEAVRSRRLPDRLGISAFLNSLALIACDRGEWEHARDQVDEGLVVARETGNRAAVARGLNILGRIELHEQHEDRALALHRDALTLFRELGEPLGIAQSLERLSVVAGARRQHETATQLFAAAAQLRERMGSSMPPVDRPEYEEMLGRIRGSLEEDRFHAIWDERRRSRSGGRDGFGRPDALAGFVS